LPLNQTVTKQLLLLGNIFNTREIPLKLILNLLGLSLLLFSSAFAANAQPTKRKSCCGYYLDVDVAYFRPNEQILRDIYSDAWVYA